MIRRLTIAVLLASSMSLLAACESAEERAERHFQAALEYIESGDYQRATVEFRNVFKLDGDHGEARLTYAVMQRDRGNIEEAYSQYLRLVEQNPNQLEGRRALAEMALDQNNWEEVERHGRAAATLAPNDPAIQAIVAALDYRDTVWNHDTSAQRKVFQRVQELAEQHPDLMIPQRIIIDNALREQNLSQAISAIDTALLLAPEDIGLYRLRLGVLNALGENAEIERQLQIMMARFPQNETVKSMLLSWYVSQGNTDAAEDFLRAQIDSEAEQPDAEVQLVRFLADQRGLEIAKTELDRLIKTNTSHRLLFRSLRAALVFEVGEQTDAIKEMQSILEVAEPSAETNNMKVTLARMLERTGNVVGARSLVEEALAADPGHVEAIKLKANWLIDDDETDAAIVSLREALGQSPRDAELMTLLARAHERNGNRDLMADMLSLAVEASDSAPRESLRYANYLVNNDKMLAAESILLDSLRLSPGNPELLKSLGRLYLKLNDWGRLDGVIEALQNTGQPGLIASANELTAQKLTAQHRADDLQSFLAEMAANTEDTVSADMALILGQLSRNNLTEALNTIGPALEANPQDNRLQFAAGALLVANEQIEEGETVFRDILAERPDSEEAWLALYRIRLLEEDSEGARELLDEALTALPENRTLNAIKAGRLEESGDIDGAIEIYESIYKDNSSDVIIANNLASLLATYRDDADSLDRAWTVARRLRGRDVPQFQDTYGWIAYRRGDHDAALAHLEPAAAGLPNDPAVQYHLAAVYAAIGQDTAALAQFRKVADLAKESPNQPYLDTVTAEIARLTATDNLLEEQTNESN